MTATERDAVCDWGCELAGASPSGRGCWSSQELTGKMLDKEVDRQMKGAAK